jgi:hypothetical protein
MNGCGDRVADAKYLAGNGVVWAQMARPSRQKQLGRVHPDDSAVMRGDVQL